MGLWAAIRAERLGESRADALRRSFAERHLPLSRPLAEALVRLEAGRIPTQEPVWGRAWRLAGESIGLPSRIGTSPQWQKTVAAFPALVVEPLLRAALARGSAWHLPGAADLGEPRGEDRIEAEVGQALADPDRMGRGFWIETAMRLWGVLSQDAPLPSPEVQPGAARLIFEFEPAFEASPDRQRRLREKMRSLRRRSGFRPKEGGVTGVRMSSALEDLPDALPSEFLFPQEIFADRFLHEGLIVRHRPPRRLPKRDLLVITRHDARPGEAAGVMALVRAAWADAMVRLRLVLAQMDLTRSDLAWAEMRPDSLRAVILSVAGVKVSAAADPFALSGALRAEHLVGSGLLPGLILATPGREDDRISSPTPERLLAHLRHRLKSRPGQGFDGFEDYGRILVLSVLSPEEARRLGAGEGWPALRAGLLAQARGLPQEARHAALVCPSAIVRGQPFTLMSDFDQRAEAPSLQPSETGEAAEALRGLTGLLSCALVELCIEALNGQ